MYCFSNHKKTLAHSTQYQYGTTQCGSCHDKVPGMQEAPHTAKKALLFTHTTFLPYSTIQCGARHTEKAPHTAKKALNPRHPPAQSCFHYHTSRPGSPPRECPRSLPETQQQSSSPVMGLRFQRPLYSACPSWWSRSCWLDCSSSPHR